MGSNGNDINFIYSIHQVLNFENTDEPYNYLQFNLNIFIEERVNYLNILKLEVSKIIFFQIFF